MDLIKFLIQKIVYGGGVIFDLAKWIILFLIVLAIVNTFFVAIFVVDGESMDPSLKDKELILWNKNSYTHSLPARGDVVAINYPGDPKHKTYVKRVVGLPGERVDIYESHVYINKVLLHENYLTPDVMTEPDGTWNLKGNQYFVMGDNRFNSNDSRYFGPVEKRFVLGKSITIIFPRFRLIGDM